MILTTHALTGAVIGKNIDNPFLIILAAISFHYLIDTFRHGEYVEIFNKNTSFKNSGWKVGLDFLAGALVVGIVLSLNHNSNILNIRNITLGILFSVLPDFVTAIYWKFRWTFLKKYYAFHSWIHKYPRHAPERLWTLRNSVNDIVISIIAIILLWL